MWSTWAILLLVTIYLARVGMGYILSLPGPTLLYLTELVNSEVKYFSIAFGGRFVGILIGGIMVGVINQKTKGKINPLYLMGLFLVIKSVFNFIVPWVHSLWLMFFIICVVGITFGYLDAGLQALILRIWGSRSSRPLIYVYHFTIGIGGFFAPIIAEPFLQSAYGDREEDPGCPANSRNVTTNSSSANNNATASSSTEGFNPVGWTYILISIYLAVVAGLAFALAHWKVDEKIIAKFAIRGVAVEARKEQPLRDVIWVFLPLIGYYFCSVSNEILFNSFIFPVSVCSDMQFSISDASLINSLYWVGFFIGRGSGIFAASYVKPRRIAMFSIAGTIIMMVVMVCFGRSALWVTWMVSPLHGFFVGPLYPSGVTWVSQVTNVSGKYMFIFIIGGMTGCSVVLPLGGVLFQNSTFSVMYLACALSCVNALFFAGAIFAAKRLKQRRREVENDKFLEEKPQES